MIIVFWTCKDAEEAEKIINVLLRENLVACASIIPGVVSMYWWKDKVEREEEVKVVLKTRDACYEGVERVILEGCSYDTPEVLRIAVEGGNEAYLKWAHEVTES
jgi:periplasmic divalent cation tolerance protein